MTITLTREEAQQVLDALERCYDVIDWPADGETPQDDAAKLLRARLSAPEPEPEPAAWAMPRPDGLLLDIITPEEHESYGGEYTTPLYTAQPQREWQGLTDEEIRRTDHHRVDGAYDYSFKQGAQWAEAKLREKNT
jgi:hypothetical protein